MTKLSIDTLSSREIAEYLPKKYGGSEILIYDSLDSTNNRAKTLSLNGAADRTVIAADRQTHGKGRQGKHFFSPAGTGIYMSVILHPDQTENPNTLYTVCAAVAVCTAIEKLTGSRPQIKWVNDIFIKDRKICGILCESVTGSNTKIPQAVIVGIGLNVTTAMAQFPDELIGIAGSLLAENVTRNRLIAEIAAGLFDLTALSDNGFVLSEYKRRCFVLGREVSYSINAVDYSGTAADINEKGNLIVKSGDKLTVLNSGEISCRLL